MKDYEKRLAEVLENGMKYCFQTSLDCHGKMSYPVLDLVAFRGTGDEAGFLDQVILAVREEVQKMFFEGYARGAIDTVLDINHSETGERKVDGGPHFIDADLNKQGAWKRWEELDKL